MNEIDASVIVPSVGRFPSLRRLLRALAIQSVPMERFEVMVVLNGAATSIPDTEWPPPDAPAPTMITSHPAGRARACNEGARAARGRLLVFLDDDMEPAPDWLAAHVAAHGDGLARLVMGPVPLVGLERSAAARFVARRFARHLSKLARPGYVIQPSDVYTGNASIERDAFLAHGGFDERIDEYGNEDRELARRLRFVGTALVFVPAAVARQHYEKTLPELLTDSRAKGRTATGIARRDPAAAVDTRLARSESRRRRALIRVLLRAPWLGTGIATAAEWLGRRDLAVPDRVIELLVDAAFWAGVNEARAQFKPRRVLHVIPSSSFGGAEQVMLWLLEGLDRQRWQSTVLYPLEATRLAGRLAATDVSRAPQRNLENGWRAIPSLARTIRRLRPDLVHIHRPWPRLGRSALVATAVARVPSVVVTDHLALARVSARAQIVRRMAEIAVDRWIAVSPAVADALSVAMGVPATRVRMIRNGVPVERYAPTRRTKGSMVQTLVMIAQLRPQKGHDVLLDAVAILPTNVFALLAGEGPLAAQLAARADDLGIADRVRMLGFVEDVRDLLAQADVVVLPSRYEGLPLVALEALAAGRPVVATDIPGTRDVIVDGRTGLLVPVDDAAALAAAIRRLLDDRALASRLGEDGRALVRSEYTVERMVAGVDAVYAELCGVGP